MIAQSNFPLPTLNTERTMSVGQKDTLTKQYISNNVVFADICNYYIYHGEPVIQPEQLRPLDPKEFALLQNPDTVKNMPPIHKQRDVLKYIAAKAAGNAAYLIIGIENQSAIHYAMPVRNMLYDALQYENQLQEITAKHRIKKENDNFVSGFQKADKLLPVITLVAYFGTKPWDGAMRLHDMLQVDDPALLHYVADYPLQLIDPHQMNDHALNQLKSSAREVFTFIKYADNKAKLNKLLQEPHYQALDPLAAEVINTCTNAGLTLQANDKEDINMCKAIDEMREDSRNEGIEIGANTTRKEMAAALLRKNIMPLEDLAELTKLSVEEIQQLQQQQLAQV